MIRPLRSAIGCLGLVFTLALCLSASRSFAQASARAIVLGWDGTVPEFALRMAREGKMPYLAKLIDGGAYADDVKPVFPSKTAPGFAALITGAPPRISGISGNRVPRAPRGQFTILETLPGFSAAPLQAETIWSAARRAGKKSVVSHVPTFAGELGAKGTPRFSGYTLIAGRDGIVVKSSSQIHRGEPWRNSPPSNALPIEIAFTIGESRLFGLLVDDPQDAQLGYDTLILAAERDGGRIHSRLKALPAGVGGEFFWSEPIAVTSGNQAARCYLRLFDLKPDGSDFFLYYTRPMRDLPLEVADDAAPGPTVRTFIGNGASFLYQQGALGRTIPNGGSGIAEARYLDTLFFAQHQLMETNRWAMENLPWDLYLAYSPFPDEAEHLWRGHLDPTLPKYQPELASRLRPFLERAYQSADEHLGLLLSKRPANALVALISDHGLQGIHKRIALNQLLQQEGLLVLDHQGRVDLTKTQVLYPPANNGYLLINSKHRKSGIVDDAQRAELVQRIRKALLAVRDDDVAVIRAVFDAAAEGEALGIGGAAGGDVYIELAPGYDFDPRIAPGVLISQSAPLGNHGSNPEQTAMRTLMVFNGPGIRAGEKIADARIIDFAPTLAALLNLPKPKDAVGRVLLESAPASRRSLRVDDPAPERSGAEQKP